MKNEIWNLIQAKQKKKHKKHNLKYREMSLTIVWRKIFHSLKIIQEKKKKTHFDGDEIVDADKLETYFSYLIMSIFLTIDHMNDTKKVITIPVG